MLSQPGLFAATTFVPLTPAPAPQLWAPDGNLLLPDPVRLLALNQPYAGLLFGDEPGEPGLKRLETRTWPWPHPASWLAIYATKTPDKGAFRRLGIRFVPESSALGATERTLLGVVLGLVWIGGCRPMVATDEKDALYPCTHGRYVWVIGASYRFQRPIPLQRGPQKFASIPKASVNAALDMPLAR